MSKISQGRCAYWPSPLDRWPAFVERHKKDSVFHTSAWLEALHRTYGYKPVVYTTNEPGQELTNGVPFCFVNSWLTGRRMVSLSRFRHQELTFWESALRDIVRRLTHN